MVRVSLLVCQMNTNNVITKCLGQGEKIKGVLALVRIIVILLQIESSYRLIKK